MEGPGRIRRDTGRTLHLRPGIRVAVRGIVSLRRPLFSRGGCGKVLLANLPVPSRVTTASPLTSLMPWRPAKAPGRRFIFFPTVLHPGQAGEGRVDAFLAHSALKERVSDWTETPTLSASAL